MAVIKNNSRVKLFIMNLSSAMLLLLAIETGPAATLCLGVSCRKSCRVNLIVPDLGPVEVVFVFWKFRFRFGRVPSVICKLADKKIIPSDAPYRRQHFANENENFGRKKALENKKKKR